jgi:cytoskeletal protein RodZ
MMMGSELGMSMVGLIWMFIFWGGLILLALWLVSLLFPAAQRLDGPKKSNTNEKRVSSNDKTTL